MQATRVNLTVNRIELSVNVLAKEMSGFMHAAATKLSEKITIQGFRPGKAPYDVIKARVSEMAILEEASHLAINKTIDQAIKENILEEWIGQPQITIIKLAPDNDFEYKALISLLPTVELGGYKDFGFKSEAVIVKDDEVEKVVDHLADSRVKEAAVNRSAEKGDKIIIDIEMFLDNVPLEGGQNKDTAVIIGKDYLVPGFDENLIGLKKDEERSFIIHYPADYQQKNIAGKKVSFKVVTKDIFSRELPKIDDDFVKSFGLKTMAELRINIKKNIEAEKTQETKHKLERQILEKIIDQATIGELPDSLITSELGGMLQELEHNVVASGAKFSDYLMSLNKTPESLKQELRPQAIERVKTSLVLRAILKAENITVVEKEIDEELEILRKRYTHSAKALETFSSPMYRRHLETVLLNRKIISNLVSWNSA